MPRHLRSALTRALAIAALLLAGSVPVAHAYQERVQTYYQYYSDSDGNLERSANFSFLTNYGTYGNTFQVSYSAISSVSVAPDLFWRDFIAATSERHSVSLAGSTYFARYTSVSYGYTRLNSDYFDTDTLTAGFSQGFFQNNSIFQVNYTWMTKDYHLGHGERSQAGLAFYSPRSVGIASGISGMYTQVLSRKTTFRIGANYSDETLYAPQWDTSLDFRQAIDQATAVHLLYRYYSNTADIRSHTYRLRVFRYLTDGVLLMVQGRWYQEEDYSDEALAYLARIRETNLFEVSSGAENWQVGGRLRFNLVALMPKLKWEKLEELNLSVQVDYHQVTKEYLGYGDPDSRIDDPNIGRVVNIGLDFLFR